MDHDEADIVDGQVVGRSNQSDKSNQETQKIQPLAPDILRSAVKREVELLQKDIFNSLRLRSTDSLLLYLIEISVAPIVSTFQLDALAISDLAKKIWPTEYGIFNYYLSKGKFNASSLTISIEDLLNTDADSVRVFQQLLIFTESIPVMEETFRQQEWLLMELRRELKNWQRQGKFQRLEISLPSEKYTAPTTSRGDLQILISTSKPTIVAGEEFSVFVVINNPFEVPIILYSVETQIPVELVDIVGRQRRKAASQLEVENDRKTREQVIKNSKVIPRLLNNSFFDFWRVRSRLAKWPEERIAQAVAASEEIIRGNNSADITLDIKMDVGTVDRGSVIGAQIDKFKSIDINIESASPQYLDQILWRLESFKRGVTPIILQPGNSVVKQFIFKTKSWLLFTPLAHTMQIQVRYNVDDRDQVDTIPFNLTIQAAITATMTGAVIGGFVGGIARMLTDSQGETKEVSTGDQVLSLLLAVILSAIAVVSFARKSGVQQLISIEDFWGGLFLGFLIGFFGQNYALNLIAPSN